MSSEKAMKVAEEWEEEWSEEWNPYKQECFATLLDEFAAEARAEQRQLCEDAVINLRRKHAPFSIVTDAIIKKTCINATGEKNNDTR